jgi:hypothetical protein
VCGLLLVSLGVLVIGGCGDVERAPGGREPEAPGVMVDSMGGPMGPITSRIARLNAAGDSARSLVARIEVQPDEMLEFYEPSPGVMVLSGAGAPTGSTLFTPGALQGRSAVEVWRRVATGLVQARRFETPPPMPQPLAEAFARLRPQAARPSSAHPGPAHPVTDSSVAQTTRALNMGEAGWCDNNYFHEQSGVWNLSWDACPDSWWPKVCHDNWWNGSWDILQPTVDSFIDVCPAKGDVSLVIDTNKHYTNGRTWGPYYVPQDTVRWWWWSNDDDGWVSMAVNQATDNRFHYRFLTSH